MDTILKGEKSIFEEKVNTSDLILPIKLVQKVDEKMTVEFQDFKEEPIEEKVEVEDLILPTKQVQKVDEKLIIEFTDVKQEPINHFENYQKYDQAKSTKHSRCTSCDASFTNRGELATIHETCFKKMVEQLNMATEKILEIEIENRKFQNNAKNLQSTIANIKNDHKSILSLNAQRMNVIVKKYERENKELHEKLSLARKEIQEYAEEREKMIYENERYIDSHTKAMLNLQNFELKNEQLSCDIEKIKDESNPWNYQRENIPSYQNVGIQTEFLASRIDSQYSTSFSFPESSNPQLTKKSLSRNKKNNSFGNVERQMKEKQHSEVIEIKSKSMKQTCTPKAHNKHEFTSGSNGKKKFKCIHCCYSSNKTNNIKRHITNVHENERNFKCATCD